MPYIYPNCTKQDRLYLSNTGENICPVRGRGHKSMPAVTPQTVINGEISILTSLDLFSRLVTKMGAANIYPDLANIRRKGI